jgi:microcompartment protein CcmK/EutM
MIPARVTAKVTGSVQHPAYAGRSLLAVRPLYAAGGERSSFLAVDTVGCGVGDDVLVARVPGLARTLLGTDRAPIRSLILGILDRHPE